MAVDLEYRLRESERARQEDECRTKELTEKLRVMYARLMSTLQDINDKNEALKVLQSHGQTLTDKLAQKDQVGNFSPGFLKVLYHSLSNVLPYAQLVGSNGKHEKRVFVS